MTDLFLKRLQDNDQAALKELFDSFYVPLTRFGSRLVADPMTAEEIVQDLFVSIWAKRHSLEIRGAWEPYLYRSVRNRCINHLNSKAHRTSSAFEDSETLQQTHSTLQDHESGELTGLIEKGLENLPRQTSTIFALSRNAGLTHAEIAAKLNVSVKTIEYHVSRALTSLRKYLEAHGYVIALVAAWLFF